MNIEKRGNKYRVRKTYKGKTYSLTFDHKPTKREVDETIAEKVFQDTNEITGTGTFEKYALKYIESKRNVLKSPTIVKYNSTLTNMPSWFKSLDLGEITQENVQIFINEYTLSHSPKSTQDIHGFISSILGFYRPNLVLRTTLPRIVKKAEYEPTDDDIRRILERAEGGRYDVIFNLLVYGLRRSEALAINFNTDLVNRKEKTTTLIINKAMVLGTDKKYYIRDDTKTPESCRTIEIANELADKIIAQGYIFDGPPHMLNKALRRYQDQLGIEHFNLHKFRHYYASMMLGLGVPITFVESSGGWKHGSTALRNAYTYSQEQKLRQQQEIGVDYIQRLKS